MGMFDMVFVWVKPYYECNRVKVQTPFFYPFSFSYGMTMIYDLRFTNYELRITIWMLARYAWGGGAGELRNFGDKVSCWLKSVRSYAMLDSPLC